MAKLQLTVKQALEWEIIEKRYHSGLGAYRWYVGNSSRPFNTGTEALKHYIDVIKPQRDTAAAAEATEDARERLAKVLNGQAFPVLKRTVDAVMYMDPITGKVDTFARSVIASTVFEMEERFGMPEQWIPTLAEFDLIVAHWRNRYATNPPTTASLVLVCVSTEQGLSLGARAADGTIARLPFTPAANNALIAAGARPLYAVAITIRNADVTHCRLIGDDYQDDDIAAVDVALSHFHCAA